MTMSLTELAIEANKPRVPCASKTCSCNDYPKRMQAFWDAATPEVILRILNDAADMRTQLSIALDELVGVEDPTPSIENAIETLRGK